jgi:hypothetical protein
MSAVSDFFGEIDNRWRGPPSPKIPLLVLGSAALFLRTDYERGTKDSDVLQTAELTPATTTLLLALAGEGTALHTRHRLYIDIVANGLPLLPHVPLYHPLDDLNASLRHFEIHVLDVVDVVVSKLKPFRVSDRDDIKAMIDRKLVPHDLLVERFRDAVDDFAGGAGAEDIPRFIKNLNRIERDLLNVPESQIDLPDWLVDRI